MALEGENTQPVSTGWMPSTPQDHKAPGVASVKGAGLRFTQFAGTGHSALTPEGTEKSALGEGGDSLSICLGCSLLDGTSYRAGRLSSL